MLPDTLFIIFQVFYDLEQHVVRGLKKTEVTSCFKEARKGFSMRLSHFIVDSICKMTKGYKKKGI